MSFLLGLTGSIGMGKTTTAAMFAKEGVPVWDADAAVHRLYAPDGAATLALAQLWPDIVDGAGVSRPKLRKMIAVDPTVLDQVQAIVHPMVALDRAAFVADNNADILLLDVPLLFETGLDEACDAVAVVSVPADEQRRRVLARAEMTSAEFEAILARQMPDAEKRTRADYVIDTSTMDAARAAVRHICADIRGKLAHA